MACVLCIMFSVLCVLALQRIFYIKSNSTKSIQQQKKCEKKYFIFHSVRSIAAFFVLPYIFLSTICMWKRRAHCLVRLPYVVQCEVRQVENTRADGLVHLYIVQPRGVRYHIKYYYSKLAVLIHTVCVPELSCCAIAQTHIGTSAIQLYNIVCCTQSVV